MFDQQLGRIAEAPDKEMRLLRSLKESLGLDRIHSTYRAAGKKLRLGQIIVILERPGPASDPYSNGGTGGISPDPDYSDDDDDFDFPDRLCPTRFC